MHKLINHSRTNPHDYVVGWVRNSLGMHHPSPRSRYRGSGMWMDGSDKSSASLALPRAFIFRSAVMFLHIYTYLTARCEQIQIHPLQWNISESMPPFPPQSSQATAAAAPLPEAHLQRVELVKLVSLTASAHAKENYLEFLVGFDGA